MHTVLTPILIIKHTHFFSVPIPSAKMDVQQIFDDIKLSLELQIPRFKSLLENATANQFCPQRSCRKCERQFLTARKIEALGDHHEDLSVDDCRSRIDGLAQRVMQDATFLHTVCQEACRNGLDLSQARYDNLIADLTRGVPDFDSIKELQVGVCEPATFRESENLGVLIPNLLHHTASQESFFKGWFRTRCAVHPSRWIASDNANLELAWNENATRTIAARCLVRFSDTDRYCSIVHLEPSILHRDDTFSADRGYLILRAQAEIYTRLRKMVQCLLPITLSQTPDIITSFGYTSGPSNAALLLERLDTRIMPEVTNLIQTTRSSLPFSGVNAFSAAQIINDVVVLEQHLLFRKAGSDSARLLSPSHRIGSRLSRLLLLDLLEKDLASLRKAAKANTQGHLSKAKLLQAWDSAEDSVSYFCTDTIHPVLEMMPVYWSWVHWMDSHQGKFRDMMSCSDKHVSLTGRCVQVCCRDHQLASSMIFVFCKDSHLKYAVQTLEEVLMQGEPALPASIHKDFLKCIGLCKRVIDALELLQPCHKACSPEPAHSRVIEHRNHLLSEVQDPKAMVVGNLMYQMRSTDPEGWCKIAMTCYQNGLEDCWAAKGLEPGMRRSF